MSAYEAFLAAYPHSDQARRVRAILAARREAAFWRRSVNANTPRAYWTYLRVYPRGPHVADARRRLAILSAQFEPPPDFRPFVYEDLPPPPPDEGFYEEQPVYAFDDLGPPPPAPPGYYVYEDEEDWRNLPPPPPPQEVGALPFLAIGIPLAVGAVAYHHRHRDHDGRAPRGFRPPAPPPIAPPPLPANIRPIAPPPPNPNPAAPPRPGVAVVKPLPPIGPTPAGGGKPPAAAPAPAAAGKPLPAPTPVPAAPSAPATKSPAAPLAPLRTPAGWEAWRAGRARGADAPARRDKQAAACAPANFANARAGCEAADGSNRPRRSSRGRQAERGACGADAASRHGQTCAAAARPRGAGWKAAGRSESATFRNEAARRRAGHSQATVGAARSCAASDRARGSRGAACARHSRAGAASRHDPCAGAGASAAAYAAGDARGAAACSPSAGDSCAAGDPCAAAPGRASALRPARTGGLPEIERPRVAFHAMLTPSPRTPIRRHVSRPTLPTFHPPATPPALLKPASVC